MALILSGANQGGQLEHPGGPGTDPEVHQPTRLELPSTGFVLILIAFSACPGEQLGRLGGPDTDPEVHQLAGPELQNSLNYAL